MPAKSVVIEKAWELLKAAPDGLRKRDLAKAMGMTQTAEVNCLITTLEHNGLLTWCDDAGRYHVYKQVDDIEAFHLLKYPIRTRIQDDTKETDETNDTDE